MDQYSDQNRRKSQDAFDGAGGSLNRGPETQGRFVWRDCVRELTRSEPRQNLERWFRPLRYIVEQDGKALIGARMPYTFSQITPALQAKISQTWSKTDPLSRPVEFVCWAELSPSVRELVNDPWAVEPDLEVNADESVSSKDETGYNVVSPSVMRFDTLVTGPSNSLAAVTCQRIADEQPVAGTIFVLCGSQGVGKTHMMRAVEAKLAATGRRRVTYISAEEFYVAYAEGARNHNTLELKERVRTADVVLFDDLQIVAGKKGTNTELAGAMRTVSERGGIFVLTTSVPHAELKGLSNEVHTVLRGAVDIEVREPDDAMRRKIVRERAEMLQAQSPGFVLSDSLVDELVERVDGTGRDLCGLL
ncbi:MAG: DnaA/Hda family protein, partial [Pseudomonadota bacterium]